MLTWASACRFDKTLTTGVISGLNRDIRSQLGSTIPGGIQTDAAINPGKALDSTVNVCRTLHHPGVISVACCCPAGNSGGPLLDSTGHLIGVNTAIFTPTGTSAGVGFAIPVDTVASVVPQLISTGRVLRASLGVQVSKGRSAVPGVPTVHAGLRAVPVAGVHGQLASSAAQQTGDGGHRCLCEFSGRTCIC